ncbi:sigma factor-like helix-turn-helix DNA-binding protein [Desulfovibrio ferrophilus]|uniref:RNA polymerase, sigma-24 subunit, ECF subfamily n=1 Tax=Desulfovibrio ferrophilus TaxID=241368 RepID=A0A2Z6B127_9BACT|nr:sigma factor-like helix-turn-helix DNA-binding protein [Desulfovibrio ferrophilus]BBD09106.1 RNA polymerase, sigma-24 subunit, ECF subfamily [Desulfovibrio ferrophilus]
MLDWQDFDQALCDGTISQNVNPDDLFELTRGTVFTTVAKTLEDTTGRLPRMDILMIVDTVYERITSMSAPTMNRERIRFGDALKFIHGFAKEVTMEYVRAVHYPTTPLARILKLLGGKSFGLELVLDESEDPLTSSQRTVLCMRHGEGMSVDETAGALGTSRNEIRTMETRALEALHLHLGALPPTATIH